MQTKSIITMKKTLRNMTLLLALACLAVACSEESRTPKKDRSVGGTSEIMVVTQNDEQWNGRIGDSLRHFFLDYQYGLPQPESRNELAHINVAGFSDMFRKHKNIIEVEINPNLAVAVAETAEDLWAAPQRYVKISAPDLTSWVELFDRQKEVYQRWFDKVERERIMNVFRPTKDEAIGKAIADKFGFTMTVPQGFYIAKSEPDFMWLRISTRMVFPVLPTGSVCSGPQKMSNAFSRMIPGSVLCCHRIPGSLISLLQTFTLKFGAVGSNGASVGANSRYSF